MNIRFNKTAFSFRKCLSLILCGVMLYEVAGLPLAEAEGYGQVWDQRRKSSVQKSVQLASLPTPMAISPKRLLDTLPAAGPASFRPDQSPHSGRLTASAPRALTDLIAAIPSTLATVRSAYAGQGGAPVLIVQDVHLNAEAQGNIAKTVRTLVTEKGIRLIGVEGAFGDFDFSNFRGSSKDTEELANAFLAENRIAAPSYLGLTLSDPLPKFFGIDDRAHYDANRAAYLQAHALQAETTASLARVRSSIEKARAAHLPAALQDFENARDAHHRGKLGLAAYARRLVAFNVEPELSLERFLVAADIEARLDFDRVDRERRTVVEKLAVRLSTKELQRLLEFSLAYRSGRVSFGQYYSELKTLCESAGLSLSSYPSFDEFVKYALLADGIDAEELFAAVHNAEAEVVQKLSRNTEDRALCDLSSRLRLTEKLIQFALTPSDWREYRELKPAAAAEPVSQLFEKLSLAPFESFYTEADQRSRTMVAAVMKARKGNAPMVLIAGGFHTPDLSRLLRERGISHAVATPRVTHVDLSDASGYLSVFAREKTPLDRLFAGEKLFIAPEMEALGNLGATGAARTEGTFLAILQAMGRLRDKRGQTDVTVSNRNAVVPLVVSNELKKGDPLAKDSVLDGKIRFSVLITGAYQTFFRVAGMVGSIADAGAAFTLGVWKLFGRIPAPTRMAMAFAAVVFNPDFVMAGNGGALFVSGWNIFHVALLLLLVVSIVAFIWTAVRGDKAESSSSRLTIYGGDNSLMVRQLESRDLPSSMMLPHVGVSHDLTPAIVVEATDLLHDAASGSVPIVSGYNMGTVAVNSALSQEHALGLGTWVNEWANDLIFVGVDMSGFNATPVHRGSPFFDPIPLNNVGLPVSEGQVMGQSVPGVYFAGVTPNTNQAVITGIPQGTNVEVVQISNGRWLRDPVPVKADASNSITVPIAAGADRIEIRPATPLSQPPVILFGTTSEKTVPPQNESPFKNQPAEEETPALHDPRVFDTTRLKIRKPGPRFDTGGNAGSISQKELPKTAPLAITAPGETLKVDEARANEGDVIAFERVGLADDAVRGAVLRARIPPAVTNGTITGLPNGTEVAVIGKDAAGRESLRYQARVVNGEVLLPRFAEGTAEIILSVTRGGQRVDGLSPSIRVGTGEVAPPSEQRRPQPMSMSVLGSKGAYFFNTDLLGSNLDEMLGDVISNPLTTPFIAGSRTDVPFNVRQVDSVLASAGLGLRDLHLADMIVMPIQFPIATRAVEDVILPGQEHIPIYYQEVDSSPGRVIPYEQAPQWWRDICETRGYSTLNPPTGLPGKVVYGLPKARQIGAIEIPVNVDMDVAPPSDKGFDQVELRRAAEGQYEARVPFAAKGIVVAGVPANVRVIVIQMLNDTEISRSRVNSGRGGDLVIEKDVTANKLKIEIESGGKPADAENLRLLVPKDGSEAPRSSLDALSDAVAPSLSPLAAAVIEGANADALSNFIGRYAIFVGHGAARFASPDMTFLDQSLLDDVLVASSPLGTAVPSGAKAMDVVSQAGTAVAEAVTSFFSDSGTVTFSSAFKASFTNPSAELRIVNAPDVTQVQLTVTLEDGSVFQTDTINVSDLNNFSFRLEGVKSIKVSAVRDGVVSNEPLRIEAIGREALASDQSSQKQELVSQSLSANYLITTTRNVLTFTSDGRTVVAKGGTKTVVAVLPEGPATGFGTVGGATSGSPSGGGGLANAAAGASSFGKPLDNLNFPIFYEMEVAPPGAIEDGPLVVPENALVLNRVGVGEYELDLPKEFTGGTLVGVPNGSDLTIIGYDAAGKEIFRQEIEKAPGRTEFRIEIFPKKIRVIIMKDEKRVDTDDKTLILIPKSASKDGGKKAGEKVGAADERQSLEQNLEDAGEQPQIGNPIPGVAPEDAKPEAQGEAVYSDGKTSMTNRERVALALTVVVTAVAASSVFGRGNSGPGVGTSSQGAGSTEGLGNTTWLTLVPEDNTTLSVPLTNEQAGSGLFVVIAVPEGQSLRFRFTLNGQVVSEKLSAPGANGTFEVAVPSGRFDKFSVTRLNSAGGLADLLVGDVAFVYLNGTRPSASAVSKPTATQTTPLTMYEFLVLWELMTYQTFIDQYLPGRLRTLYGNGEADIELFSGIRVRIKLISYPQPGGSPSPKTASPASGQSGTPPVQEKPREQPSLGYVIPYSFDIEKPGTPDEGPEGAFGDLVFRPVENQPGTYEARVPVTLEAATIRAVPQGTKLVITGFDANGKQVWTETIENAGGDVRVEIVLGTNKITVKLTDKNGNAVPLPGNFRIFPTDPRKKQGNKTEDRRPLQLVPDQKNGNAATESDAAEIAAGINVEGNIDSEDSQPASNTEGSSTSGLALIGAAALSLLGVALTATKKAAEKVMKTEADTVERPTAPRRTRTRTSTTRPQVRDREMHFYFSTRYGLDYLETWEGRDGLRKDPRLLDSPEGQRWLSTRRGERWLRSADGAAYLASNRGIVFLGTASGRRFLSSYIGGEWLRTAPGRIWLGTPAGFNWLATRAGAAWLSMPSNNWIPTGEGLRFLQTEAGHRWLLTAGEGWLNTRLGQIFLASAESNSFLSSRYGGQWLSGISGQIWLGTPQGFQWLATNSGRLWIESNDAAGFRATPLFRAYISSAFGQGWLSSEFGQAWLTDAAYSTTEIAAAFRSTDQFSRILRTPAGTDWLLSTVGISWISSTDGHLWFTSEAGIAFLGSAVTPRARAAASRVSLGRDATMADLLSSLLGRAWAEKTLPASITEAPKKPASAQRESLVLPAIYVSVFAFFSLGASSPFGIMSVGVVTMVLIAASIFLSALLLVRWAVRSNRAARSDTGAPLTAPRLDIRTRFWYTIVVAAALMLTAAGLANAPTITFTVLGAIAAFVVTSVIWRPLGFAVVQAVSRVLHRQRKETVAAIILAITGTIFMPQLPTFSSLRNEFSPAAQQAAPLPRAPPIGNPDMARKGIPYVTGIPAIPIDQRRLELGSLDATLPKAYLDSAIVQARVKELQASLDKMNAGAVPISTLGNADTANVLMTFDVALNGRQQIGGKSVEEARKEFLQLVRRIPKHDGGPVVSFFATPGPVVPGKKPYEMHRAFEQKVRAGETIQLAKTAMMLWALSEPGAERTELFSMARSAMDFLVDMQDPETGELMFSTARQGPTGEFQITFTGLVRSFALATGEDRYMDAYSAAARRLVSAHYDGRGFTAGTKDSAGFQNAEDLDPWALSELGPDALVEIFARVDQITVSEAIIRVRRLIQNLQAQPRDLIVADWYVSRTNGLRWGAAWLDNEAKNTTNAEADALRREAADARTGADRLTRLLFSLPLMPAAKGRGMAYSYQIKTGAVDRFDAASWQPAVGSTLPFLNFSAPDGTARTAMTYLLALRQGHDLAAPVDPTTGRLIDWAGLKGAAQQEAGRVAGTPAVFAHGSGTPFRLEKAEDLARQSLSVRRAVRELLNDIDGRKTFLAGVEILPNGEIGRRFQRADSLPAMAFKVPYDRVRTGAPTETEVAAGIRWFRGDKGYAYLISPIPGGTVLLIVIPPEGASVRSNPENWNQILTSPGMSEVPFSSTKRMMGQLVLLGRVSGMVMEIPVDAPSGYLGKVTPRAQQLTDPADRLMAENLIREMELEARFAQGVGRQKLLDYASSLRRAWLAETVTGERHEDYPVLREIRTELQKETFGTPRQKQLMEDYRQARIDLWWLADHRAKLNQAMEKAEIPTEQELAISGIPTIQPFGPLVGQLMVEARIAGIRERLNAAQNIIRFGQESNHFRDPVTGRFNVVASKGGVARARQSLTGIDAEIGRLRGAVGDNTAQISALTAARQRISGAIEWAVTRGYSEVTSGINNFERIYLELDELIQNLYREVRDPATTAGRRDAAIAELAEISATESWKTKTTRYALFYGTSQSLRDLAAYRKAQIGPSANHRGFPSVFGASPILPTPTDVRFGRQTPVTEGYRLDSRGLTVAAITEGQGAQTVRFLRFQDILGAVEGELRGEDIRINGVLLKNAELPLSSDARITGKNLVFVRFQNGQMATRPHNIFESRDLIVRDATRLTTDGTAPTVKNFFERVEARYKEGALKTRMERTSAPDRPGVVSLTNRDGYQYQEKYNVPVWENPDAYLVERSRGADWVENHSQQFFNVKTGRTVSGHIEIRVGGFLVKTMDKTGVDKAGRVTYAVKEMHREVQPGGAVVSVTHNEYSATYEGRFLHSTFHPDRNEFVFRDVGKERALFERTGEEFDLRAATVYKDPANGKMTMKVRHNVDIELDPDDRFVGLTETQVLAGATRDAASSSAPLPDTVSAIIARDAGKQLPVLPAGQVHEWKIIRSGPVAGNLNNFYGDSVDPVREIETPEILTVVSHEPVATPLGRIVIGREIGRTSYRKTPTGQFTLQDGTLSALATIDVPTAAGELRMPFGAPVLEGKTLKQGAAQGPLATAQWDTRARAIVRSVGGAFLMDQAPATHTNGRVFVLNEKRLVVGLNENASQEVQEVDPKGRAVAVYQVIRPRNDGIRAEHYRLFMTGSQWDNDLQLWIAGESEMQSYVVATANPDRPAEMVAPSYRTVEKSKSGKALDFDPLMPDEASGPLVRRTFESKHPILGDTLGRPQTRVFDAGGRVVSITKSIENAESVIYFPREDTMALRNVHAASTNIKLPASNFADTAFVAVSVKSGKRDGLRMIFTDGTNMVVIGKDGNGSFYSTEEAASAAYSIKNGDKVVQASMVPMRDNVRAVDHPSGSDIVIVPVADLLLLGLDVTKITSVTLENNEGNIDAVSDLRRFRLPGDATVEGTPLGRSVVEVDGQKKISKTAGPVVVTRGSRGNTVIEYGPADSRISEVWVWGELMERTFNVREGNQVRPVTVRFVAAPDAALTQPFAMYDSPTGWQSALLVDSSNLQAVVQQSIGNGYQGVKLEVHIRYEIYIENGEIISAPYVTLYNPYTFIYTRLHNGILPRKNIPANAYNALLRHLGVTDPFIAPYLKTVDVALLDAAGRKDAIAAHFPIYGHQRNPVPKASDAAVKGSMPNRGTAANSSPVIVDQILGKALTNPTGLPATQTGNEVSDLAYAERLQLYFAAVTDTKDEAAATQAFLPIWNRLKEGREPAFSAYNVMHGSPEERNIEYNVPGMAEKKILPQFAFADVGLRYWAKTGDERGLQLFFRMFRHGLDYRSKVNGKNGFVHWEPGEPLIVAGLPNAYRPPDGYLTVDNVKAYFYLKNFQAVLNQMKAQAIGNPVMQATIERNAAEIDLAVKKQEEWLRKYVVDRPHGFLTPARLREQRDYRGLDQLPNPSDVSLIVEELRTEAESSMLMILAKKRMGGYSDEVLRHDLDEALSVFGVWVQGPNGRRLYGLTWGMPTSVREGLSPEMTALLLMTASEIHHDNAAALARMSLNSIPLQNGLFPEIVGIDANSVPLKTGISTGEGQIIFPTSETTPPPLMIGDAQAPSALQPDRTAELEKTPRRFEGQPFVTLAVNLAENGNNPLSPIVLGNQAKAQLAAGQNAVLNDPTLDLSEKIVDQPVQRLWNVMWNNVNSVSITIKVIIVKYALLFFWTILTWLAFRGMRITINGRTIAKIDGYRSQFLNWEVPPEMIAALNGRDPQQVYRGWLNDFATDILGVDHWFGDFSIVLKQEGGVNKASAESLFLFNLLITYLTLRAFHDTTPVPGAPAEATPTQAEIRALVYGIQDDFAKRLIQLGKGENPEEVNQLVYDDREIFLYEIREELRARLAVRVGMNPRPTFWNRTRGQLTAENTPSLETTLNRVGMVKGEGGVFTFDGDTYEKSLNKWKRTEPLSSLGTGSIHSMLKLSMHVFFYVFWALLLIAAFHGVMTFGVDPWLETIPTAISMAQNVWGTRLLMGGLAAGVVFRLLAYRSPNLSTLTPGVVRLLSRRRLARMGSGLSLIASIIGIMFISPPTLDMGIIQFAFSGALAAQAIVRLVWDQSLIGNTLKWMFSFAASWSGMMGTIMFHQRLLLFFAIAVPLGMNVWPFFYASYTSAQSIGIFASVAGFAVAALLPGLYKKLTWGTVGNFLVTGAGVTTWLVLGQGLTLHLSLGLGIGAGIVSAALINFLGFVGRELGLKGVKGLKLGLPSLADYRWIPMKHVIATGLLIQFWISFYFNHEVRMMVAGMGLILTLILSRYANKILLTFFAGIVILYKELITTPFKLRTVPSMIGYSLFSVGLLAGAGWLFLLTASPLILIAQWSVGILAVNVAVFVVIALIQKAYRAVNREPRDGFALTVMAGLDSLASPAFLAAAYVNGNPNADSTTKLVMENWTRYRQAKSRALYLWAYANSELLERAAIGYGIPGQLFRGWPIKALNEKMADAVISRLFNELHELEISADFPLYDPDIQLWNPNTPQPFSLRRPSQTDEDRRRLVLAHRTRRWMIDVLSTSKGGSAYDTAISMVEGVKVWRAEKDRNPALFAKKYLIPFNFVLTAGQDPRMVDNEMRQRQKLIDLMNFIAGEGEQVAVAGQLVPIEQTTPEMRQAAGLEPIASGVKVAGNFMAKAVAMQGVSYLFLQSSNLKFDQANILAVKDRNGVSDDPYEELRDEMDIMGDKSLGSIFPDRDTKLGPQTGGDFSLNPKYGEGGMSTIQRALLAVYNTEALAPGWEFRESIEGMTKLPVRLSMDPLYPTKPLTRRLRDRIGTWYSNWDNAYGSVGAWINLLFQSEDYGSSLAVAQTERDIGVMMWRRMSNLLYRKMREGGPSYQLNAARWRWVMGLLQLLASTFIRIIYIHAPISFYDKESRGDGEEYYLLSPLIMANITLMGMLILLNWTSFVGIDAVWFLYGSLAMLVLAVHGMIRAIRLTGPITGPAKWLSEWWTGITVWAGGVNTENAAMNQGLVLGLNWNYSFNPSAPPVLTIDNSWQYFQEQMANPSMAGRFKMARMAFAEQAVSGLIYMGFYYAALMNLDVLNVVLLYLPLLVISGLLLANYVNENVIGRKGVLHWMFKPLGLISGVLISGLIFVAYGILPGASVYAGLAIAIISGFYVLAKALPRAAKGGHFSPNSISVFITSTLLALGVLTMDQFFLFTIGSWMAFFIGRTLINVGLWLFSVLTGLNVRGQKVPNLIKPLDKILRGSISWLAGREETRARYATILTRNTILGFVASLWLGIVPISGVVSYNIGDRVVPMPLADFVFGTLLIILVGVIIMNLGAMISWLVDRFVFAGRMKKLVKEEDYGRTTAGDRIRSSQVNSLWSAALSMIDVWGERIFSIYLRRIFLIIRGRGPASDTPGRANPRPAAPESTTPLPTEPEETAPVTLPVTTVNAAGATGLAAVMIGGVAITNTKQLFDVINGLSKQGQFDNYAFAILDALVNNDFEWTAEERLARAKVLYLAADLYSRSKNMREARRLLTIVYGELKDLPNPDQDVLTKMRDLIGHDVADAAKPIGKQEPAPKTVAERREKDETRTPPPARTASRTPVGSTVRNTGLLALLVILFGASGAQAAPLEGLGQAVVSAHFNPILILVAIASFVLILAYKFRARLFTAVAAIARAATSGGTKRIVPLPTNLMPPPSQDETLISRGKSVARLYSIASKPVADRSAEELLEAINIINGFPEEAPLGVGTAFDRPSADIGEFQGQLNGLRDQSLQAVMEGVDLAYNKKKPTSVENAIKETNKGDLFEKIILTPAGSSINDIVRKVRALNGQMGDRRFEVEVRLETDNESISVDDLAAALAAADLGFSFGVKTWASLPESADIAAGELMRLKDGSKAPFVRFMVSQGAILPENANAILQTLSSEMPDRLAILFILSDGAQAVNLNLTEFLDMKKFALIASQA